MKKNSEMYNEIAWKMVEDRTVNILFNQVNVKTLEWIDKEKFFT